MLVSNVTQVNYAGSIESSCTAGVKIITLSAILMWTRKGKGIKVKYFIIYFYISKWFLQIRL